MIAKPPVSHPNQAIRFGGLKNFRGAWKSRQYLVQARFPKPSVFLEISAALEPAQDMALSHPQKRYV